MNEKTLRALVEAGAVKRVRIVADGARFHVEADTPTATVVAATGKGTPRTWGSLDGSRGSEGSESRERQEHAS